MLESFLHTLTAVAVGCVSLFAVVGFAASAALPLVLQVLESDEQTDD